MNRFCDQCGAEVRDSARFCNTCGSRVEAAPTGASPAAPVRRSRGGPVESSAQPPHRLPPPEAGQGMDSQGATDLSAQRRPSRDQGPDANSTPVLELRVSRITLMLSPWPWLLLALTVALAALSVWLGLPWYLPLGVAIILVVVMLVRWLSWRTDHLTIFPDRIIRHSGFLNRKEEVVPLQRIQDVSSVHKWYGFGWFSYETAGQDSDATFGPIRHASEIRDTIYRLLQS